MRVGRWAFQGSHSGTGHIHDKPGVYIVLGKPGAYPDAKYDVVDVGRTKELRFRLDNHDREDCWHDHCVGAPVFAILYEGDMSARKRIEKYVRDEFDPPCGDR